MPFQKGNPGRPKGALNKATVEAKEFLRQILLNPKAQKAVLQRIEDGDTAAYFKAMEFVFGKPRQSIDLNTDDKRWIQWPDKRDVDDSVEAEAGMLPPGDE